MGLDLGMVGRNMSLPIFLQISNNLAVQIPRNVNGKITAELPGLCVFRKEVRYYDQEKRAERAE